MLMIVNFFLFWPGALISCVSYDISRVFSDHSFSSTIDSACILNKQIMS
jgi:hypothetical protein